MSDIAKLPLSTPDIKTEQIEKLRQLFPEVFTEGDKLDFDRLRATLGDLVDDGPERFGLTWPGKRDCFRLIQEPSTGTLLPVEEESVNWDTTQNLFIEADNLEALKLLQKSYYGKVKMIYIDPPYNTGKDFIYPDRYAENLQTYLAYTGQASDEGYRFSTNPDTDGRFHSRWLNMMYPRLFLARNLLRDDGVIFVSINDTEVHNLRIIINEIFGEENLLAQFVVRTDGNFDNQAKVKNCHEYVLAYTKVLEKFPHPPIIDPNVKPNSKLYREEIRNTIVKNGPKNPISGIELPIGFPADFASGILIKREDAFPWYSNDVVIEEGKTQNLVTVSSGWSSKELLLEFIKNSFEPIEDRKGQETIFSISNSGAIEIIKRRKENQSHVISVLTGLGSVQSMAEELKKEGIFFSYPKPYQLLKYLIGMNEGKDFVVLDFFSGSSTTAHAVLDLNKEDGGNRQFILVQLPEPTDETSEAAKAGYRTIADIGKERIRRVIGRIEAEAIDLEQKISATQATLEDLAKEEEALKADQPKELFGEAKPSKELTKIQEKQEKAQEELEQAQEQLENIRQCDLGFRVFRLGESNFKVWDGDLEKEDLGKQLEMALDYIRPERSEQDMLFELLIKSGFPLTTPVEKLILAGKTVWSVAEGSMLVCLERPLTQEVIRAMAAMNPPRVVVLDAGFMNNDPLKTNAVQIMRSHGVEDFRTV